MQNWQFLEETQDYNMEHSKIDNTFMRSMAQINNLEKVFREGGLLEKAISDIKGDVAWLKDIREALSNAYKSLEEGHYGTTGHLDVPESAEPQSVTQEAGAPDYNPSRGEYASERDYGMFTDEGNAEVAEIVDDIVKRHEAGEFDSPERAIDAAMSDLMNLSDDNSDFAEADDTDVRDQVARDLESRIGRDSGFGEAIEYMKKLAGLEQ